MAKIDDIYQAVDDYGLVTSAQAAALGMSRAELVQQAQRGKLVRVARGVYRMPVWPSQPQDPYAIAVKAAGEDALLYGESVIALLGLAPTNPGRMWIGTPKRTRRDLGKGARVVYTKTPATYLEGIPCQAVAEAIICAARTMGFARALQAANEALNRGYITKEEMKTIEEALA